MEVSRKLYTSAALPLGKPPIFVVAGPGMVFKENLCACVRAGSIVLWSSSPLPYHY